MRLRRRRQDTPRYSPPPRPGERHQRYGSDRPRPRRHRRPIAGSRRPRPGGRQPRTRPRLASSPRVSRSVLSDRKGTARPAPGGHRDGLRDNKEATPACAAGVVRAALEQANSALATATAFGRIAGAGGATPTRPVDGVDLLGEPPPMGRSLLLESPKDGRVIDVRQNVSQGVLPVDEAQPVARFAAV